MTLAQLHSVHSTGRYLRRSTKRRKMSINTPTRHRGARRTGPWSRQQGQVSHDGSIFLRRDFAEVEVDTETGNTTSRIPAVADVGTVIHPKSLGGK